MLWARACLNRLTPTALGHALTDARSTQHRSQLGTHWQGLTQACRRSHRFLLQQRCPWWYLQGTACSLHHRSLSGTTQQGTAGRRCSCHLCCLGRAGGLCGSGGQHNRIVILAQKNSINQLDRMLIATCCAVPATVNARCKADTAIVVLLSAGEMKLLHASKARVSP